MSGTIEELKKEHILSKTELEQAKINVDSILERKDGEAALVGIYHFFNAINKYDFVMDVLFSKIDSLDILPKEIENLEYKLAKSDGTANERFFLLREADKNYLALKSENSSLITTIEQNEVVYKECENLCKFLQNENDEFLTTIESQKEQLESQRQWQSSLLSDKEVELIDRNLEIKSLKAITELAVTCLQRIDSIRETFPISFQPHHVEAAFIKAERLTTEALEEIERLQNATS